MWCGVTWLFSVAFGDSLWWTIGRTPAIATEDARMPRFFIKTPVSIEREQFAMGLATLAESIAAFAGSGGSEVPSLQQ